MRSLKFLTLLYPHARRSDPDRPSGISPHENLRSMFVFSVGRLVSRRCHRISLIASAYRFLCRGFRFVNNVATGFGAFNEAEIASGWYDTPLAYRFLGLRFTALSSPVEAENFRPHRSASGARLDTGGWLALTAINLVKSIFFQSLMIIEQHPVRAFPSGDFPVFSGATRILQKELRQFL